MVLSRKGRRMLKRSSRSSAPSSDVSTIQFFEGAGSQQPHATALEKQELNSLLPISRIPPELVTRIMKIYIAASPFFPRLCRPSYKAHLLVTHIFSSWRAIALDSPTLWSKIFISNTPLTPVLLQRSQQAPLMVTAFSQQADVTSIMPVFEEFHRFRSAVLELEPETFSVIEASQIVCQSAPQLEKLNLLSSRGSSATHDLPTLFDHCDLPALRKLELTGFSVDWSSPLFRPSLSHLSISCLGPSPHVHLSDLLQALQGMPNLGYLCLADMLPPSSQYDVSPTQVVHLPHLTQLLLADTWRECASLLGHLSFPPNTKISLQLIGIHGSSDLPQISSALASGLFRTTFGEGSRSAHFDPIISLSVRQDIRRIDDTIIPFSSISCYTSYVSPDVLPSLFHPRPDPTLSIYFHTDFHTDDLSEAVLHLPIDTVKSCYLGDQLFTDWKNAELARKLVNVEDMLVGGREVRKALEFFQVDPLVTRPIEGGDGLKQNSIMPRLRKLDLFLASRSEGKAEDAEEVAVQAQKFLRMRRDAGVPIEQFSIAEDTIWLSHSPPASSYVQRDGTPCVLKYGEPFRQILFAHNEASH